ncbi:MAG TPA: hypothetical protein PK321_06225 [Clostridia bacterium]|jgi:hypothetical protein|nr:hypothetical protein [Clostridia bacterium]HQO55913.1 hypothetical protein [Clostridia bacterium]
MKTAKRKALIGVSVLIIALSLMVVAYMYDNDVLRMLTIATAVFGAFTFWYEMRTVHKIAEGEFILNLNNCFIENSKLNEFYEHLYFKRQITDDDWVSLITYLTFFETLLVLIRRNIISIQVIDDLFSNRFFSLVSNLQVQERDLLKYPEVNRNIFTLDFLWREYRKKANLYEYPNSILDKHPAMMKYVKL